MYAIDEKSLHRIVMRKISTSTKQVNAFEFGMIGIYLFVGIFLIIDGIMDRTWTDILIASASFFVMGYVMYQRRRRLKLEGRFNESLLGGLDNAIAKIDYLIKRGRTFLWWNILPLGIAIFISFLTKPSPIWGWGLVLAAFVLAYWLTQWEVRKLHMPKKETLEALKRTLTQDQDYVDLR